MIGLARSLDLGEWVNLRFCLVLLGKFIVTDPSASAANEDYGYLMLLPIDEFQRLAPP